MGSSSSWPVSDRDFERSIGSRYECDCINGFSGNPMCGIHYKSSTRIREERECCCELLCIIMMPVHGRHVPDYAEEQ